MPTVRNKKTGEVRHFAYDEAGLAAAKRAARKPGIKMTKKRGKKVAGGY